MQNQYYAVFYHIKENRKDRKIVGKKMFIVNKNFGSNYALVLLCVSYLIFGSNDALFDQ